MRLAIPFSLRVIAEFLWLPGLLLILELQLLSHLYYGERFEQRAYFLFGLTFLAGCGLRYLLNLLTAHRHIPRGITAIAWAGQAVAASILASFATGNMLNLRGKEFAILVPAFLLVSLFADGWRNVRRQPWGMVLFFAWLCAVALDASLRIYWPGNLLTTITLPLTLPYHQSLLLGLLLLVCAGLMTNRPHSLLPSPQWKFLPGWLLVAFLIGYSICHIPPITNPFGLGHWNYVVAPAVLVRQGGWLLWDVPVQYGPGMALTMALLPFESAWNSMFYLYAACQVIVGTIIFWLLFRPLQPGSRQFFSFLTAHSRNLLAAALSLVIVLSALQWQHILIFFDMMNTPSTSPLRFIWGYLLVVWAYAAYCSHMQQRAMSPFLHRLGLTLWVIGVAWSIESATFSTLAFGPAYCLFCAIERGWTATQRRFLLQSWAAVRAGLRMGVALWLLLAGVALYYLIFLKHMPFWAGYYDAIVHYAKGLSAVGITWSNGVQMFLMSGMVLMGATLYAIGRGRANASLCVFLIACFLFGWGGSSYAIGRSTDNNFTNISPLMIFCIGFAWRALLDAPAARPAANLCRIALLCLCCGVAHPTLLRAPYLVQRLQELTFSGDVRTHVQPEPKIEAVIAALQPRDWITIVNEDMANAFDTSQISNWLPVTTAIFVQTEIPWHREEQRGYYQRYIDRVCNNAGWLVTPYSLEERYPVIAEVVNKNFNLIMELQHEGWFMRRYLRKIPCPPEDR